MPRKPKTSARSTPKAVATPTGNDLGLSELRVRLNFLEQENEKLLNQIEKSRKELSNLTESIEEVGIKIRQQSAPAIQKLFDLDRQIHEVFEDIFTNRKLGKQSRQKIEFVYSHLQADGIISPKAKSRGKNLDDQDPDFDAETDWRYHERRAQRESEIEDEKPDREELKKIRQIYLRLAEIFHPDKLSDEADKEYCTEVMKEINQAYQTGDLAKLLAIEKQQALGMTIDRDNTDDLARHCAKVEAENAFLKEQLASVKKEVRLTKKTHEGAMVTQYKKMTKHGLDPIAEALEQMDEQIQAIDDLYQFVVSFRDRRITIAEFLRGPKMSFGDDGMSEEELLMEFLSRF
jgi:hypothetical protein